MTKLFTIEQVKKFFDILSRLERSSCNWYKGWDKLNPDIFPCQQAVFVKRTIGKWLVNKPLIWYYVCKSNHHYDHI